MQEDHLFVYGTLMRSVGAPAHALLARGARYLCPASLPGRLFEIDGYPGVVEVDGNPDRVLGELYATRAPGPLLLELDEYEQCSPSFPAPWEYRRVRRQVRPRRGDPVLAWVYLYNHDVDGRIVVPGGDYARFRARRRPPG